LHSFNWCAHVCVRCLLHAKQNAQQSRFMLQVVQVHTV
jgi:hypothetical protein